MRVWLVTCLILFASVQFYQWAKGFVLPLPIYVLAGAFLSIASNYDRGIASLLQQATDHPILSPLGDRVGAIEAQGTILEEDDE